MKLQKLSMGLALGAMLTTGIAASTAAQAEDGHFIPAEDVTWARPVDEDGNRETRDPAGLAENAGARVDIRQHGSGNAQGFA